MRGGAGDDALRGQRGNDAALVDLAVRAFGEEGGRTSSEAAAGTTSSWATRGGTRSSAAWAAISSSPASGTTSSAGAETKMP